jgi:hypothetical protein
LYVGASLDSFTNIKLEVSEFLAFRDSMYLSLADPDISMTSAFSIVRARYHTPWSLLRFVIGRFWGERATCPARDVSLGALGFGPEGGRLEG